MIHAYSELYRDNASIVLGCALHYAVYELGLKGEDFLRYFASSFVAHSFERGSPRYIAGLSGIDLAKETLLEWDVPFPDIQTVELLDRSPEYWIGHVLSKYQWYTAKSFKAILDRISYPELERLYYTLHEADITKVFDVFDAHFEESPCNLKIRRKAAGLTQEELSARSGVSLATIRAYERKGKDIKKASYEILKDLSVVLCCSIEELVD